MKKRNADDSYHGMPTPWGPADDCRVLRPGVIRVYTAVHGGLLLEARLASRLLSPAACRIGQRWGRYLTFEEDCEIAAFAYEQPELFDNGENPEAHRQEAEDILRMFYPEYFTARQAA